MDSVMDACPPESRQPLTSSQRTADRRDEAGDPWAQIEDLRKALDISQRKFDQAQRELEMAESDASAQSHFLARMSHEIRTPMNAILAPAQLLSETVTEPSQQELVGMLLRAGEHLLHVIDTILDFSKLEAGKMILKNEPFEVEGLVTEVLAPFTILAEAKEIELTHAIEAGAGGAWIGDAPRIRQVILNLVSNAIKFTCGGEVGLRVSLWQSEKEDGGLEFEVRDSGPGISLDETERIFLPFEQSSVVHGSRPGGTGLGLAICRELVDLMGGILGVDSVPGEGSQFWFRIPLLRADPGLVEDKRSAQKSAAVPLPEWKDPPNILIVEDNSSNRKVISLLLKRLGCGVSFAADGHQALEALSLSNFDMVLMDCEMPGMNGYDCAKELRSMEDGVARRMPVVALSAHVGDVHLERCLQAGMDAVLSKPISLAELRSTLAKFLTDDSVGSV